MKTSSQDSEIGRGMSAGPRAFNRAGIPRLGRSMLHFLRGFESLRLTCECSDNSAYPIQQEKTVSSRPSFVPLVPVYGDPLAGDGSRTSEDSYSINSWVIVDSSIQPESLAGILRAHGRGRPGQSPEIATQVKELRPSRNGPGKGREKNLDVSLLKNWCSESQHGLRTKGDSMLQNDWDVDELIAEPLNYVFQLAAERDHAQERAKHWRNWAFTFASIGVIFGVALLVSLLIVAGKL